MDVKKLVKAAELFEKKVAQFSTEPAINITPPGGELGTVYPVRNMFDSIRNLENVIYGQIGDVPIDESDPVKSRIKFLLDAAGNNTANKRYLLSIGRALYRIFRDNASNTDHFSLTNPAAIERQLQTYFRDIERF